MVDVAFGQWGLKRARLTADTEPLRGSDREAVTDATDTIEFENCSSNNMDFHLVFRYLWHLGVRVGFRLEKSSWILFPLSGNGTTLTFVPHEDPILFDSETAIKHRPAHLVLNW